jgi:hypothetical protein
MGPERLIGAIVVALLALANTLAAQGGREEPSLQAVMARVGSYVDAYGEKASLIVAVEEYTQHVPHRSARPLQLISEFAIVKASRGWVGYRDVVAVNGEQISDRRDRLLSILTDPSADSRLVKKLSDESARFNIGPISRNFNVPTATLLLFGSANLDRFSFAKKKNQKIDGIETWEIEFKETRTPTLTMTRAGVDVPMFGSLWVVPADGVVVRTRMQMRDFAGTTAAPAQTGAPSQPAVNTTSPAGLRDARGFDLELQEMKSSADFNVTYRRHAEFDMWLPERMTEMYEGPYRPQPGRPPVQATTNATAKYSQFKQFNTGAKINVPQQ